MSTNPYYKEPGVLLYRADCLELLQQWPDECVDLVLTDPPYLVEYKGRWNSDWGKRPMKNDHAGAAAWLYPVYHELWRVLKPNRYLVSYYGWPYVDHFMGAWKQAGFKPVSHLAVIKRMGLGYKTRSKHETAFLLTKGKAKSTIVIPDVIEAGPMPQQRLHPTQKAMQATVTMIDAFCPLDGIVLDPFVGSGTTLWAARIASPTRRAIGVEIDKEWCNVARRKGVLTWYLNKIGSSSTSARTLSATS